MAGSKEIRTKIKSVQNTRKITKAMEMVAASKMRKAQERMRHSRPYGDKIRNLVGSKSPEARLAAVVILAKSRDLNNVETLIYALTDPDYRVVRAANTGLLRMRRVPTVVVLPDNLTEEDRRLLVEKWKAWYQAIRPSAEVKY